MRLTAALPEGMAVTGAAPLADRAPALQEAITALAYRVDASNRSPPTVLSGSRRRVLARRAELSIEREPQGRTVRSRTSAPASSHWLCARRPSRPATRPTLELRSRPGPAHCGWPTSSAGSAPCTKTPRRWSEHASCAPTNGLSAAARGSNRSTSTCAHSLPEERRARWRRRVIRKGRSDVRRAHRHRVACAERSGNRIAEPRFDSRHRRRCPPGHRVRGHLRPRTGPDGASEEASPARFARRSQPPQARHRPGRPEPGQPERPGPEPRREPVRQPDPSPGRARRRARARRVQRCRSRPWPDHRGPRRRREGGRRPRPADPPGRGRAEAPDRRHPSRSGGACRGGRRRRGGGDDADGDGGGDGTSKSGTRRRRRGRARPWQGLGKWNRSGGGGSAGTAPARLLEASGRVTTCVPTWASATPTTSTSTSTSTTRRWSAGGAAPARAVRPAAT